MPGRARTASPRWSVRMDWKMEITTPSISDVSEAILGYVLLVPDHPFLIGSRDFVNRLRMGIVGGYYVAYRIVRV